MKQIENTISYYQVKQKEILEIINSNSTLTVDEIISYGEELSILEYKLTALEVAKEN